MKARAAGVPVAVTGCGVVSPIGRDLADFDSALFAGASAVRAWPIELPGFDLPPVPIAACADFAAAAIEAPSKLPLDRGSALALASAADAMRAAALASTSLDHERLAVYWGSGMAGAATFEATCRTVYAERRRMRPTSVITTMPNAPLAEIALACGARGGALAYACACASSAVAIGEAMRAIRSGAVDVAIAGGSESMLTPGVLASWQAMRVLAPLGPRLADIDPMLAANACRPFALDRSGFALGEAAGALVLESLDHARARGARVLAQLVGYANNCDGFHITQPDACGQARAMGAALVDAGLAAASIGYVNAHGTATAAGDAAEAASLASVFGARGVAVSSTKAIHGHLLGAGGAVELIAALRALAGQRVPPNGNRSQVDPAFELDVVDGIARPMPGLRYALSNSFAFGGTNAVLIAARGDIP